MRLMPTLRPTEESKILRKYAPPDRSAKDATKLSVVTFIFGLCSLFAWNLGVFGIMFGIWGIILSLEIESKKGILLSVLGIALCVFSVSYYFIQM